MEIAEILSHTFFRKNFVKTIVLVKKLPNSLFDEIFFSEREFLVFPHCVVICEFIPHDFFLQKFRQIKFTKD